MRVGGKVRVHKGEDAEAAVRASIKLEAVDIVGVVQAITSDCSYVVPDTKSFETLLLKHPPIPPDWRPVPNVPSHPCSCSIQQVFEALRSFKPGSAAGLDGLRPQHIQDMVKMSGPEALPSALVEFVNPALERSVPLPVRQVFFGAKPLCPPEER